MSQENVETIRRAFDAWNRGDRGAWLALSHPEVEWSSAVLRQVEGNAGVHRGREEIGRFWDDWHDLWELEIDVSELRDLGDTVVAKALIRTHGKSSGMEMEQAAGYVFRLRDGLVKRGEAFLTFEAALEAAGLPE